MMWTLKITTFFHIIPDLVHGNKTMDETPYEIDAYYIFERSRSEKKEFSGTLGICLCANFLCHRYLFSCSNSTT